MAANHRVVTGLALAGIVAFLVTGVVLAPRFRDASRPPPPGAAEPERPRADTGARRPAGAPADLSPTAGEDPAVVAALAEAAAASRHPDVERNPEFPVYPRPELTTIRVGPDTVWFVGRAGYDGWGEYEVTEPPSFAWVRSTARWARLGFRPDLGEPADPLRPLGADTVEVAPGVRLAHLPNHLTRFHVLMLEDGSTRPLPDRIPADVKRRLVAAVPSYPEPDPGTVAEFPVEGRVSAWLVADSVLWLGRAGSWSEGTGGLGGVVRYGLADGRLESLWTEPLAVSTVTGLARAGGRLWVGSLRPVEGPPVGHAGVLVLDPESETWERLTPGSSPLPGTLVWALAGSGDSVWIATDEGVAAVDAATGEWSVRWFQPVLVGDSVVQALVEERPDLDPVAEVAFRLMAELGVERRADFVAAVRRAPAEPFLEVYRDRYSPVRHRVLARPDFVPFLEEAVRAERGLDLALASLGRIPASEWDPAPAIELVGSGPRRFQVTAAAALARAGHPEGLRWLRERLAGGDDVADGVLRALGEAGDTASIPGIARFLGDSVHGWAAYQALREMGADTAWRAVLRAGRERPGVRERLLRDAGTEGGISAADPAFDPEIEEIARLALAEGSRVAAAFLLRRGDTSGVPLLLDSLEGDDHLLTVLGFIAATGVDSAPPAHWGDGPEARRRSTEFWRRWWAENGTSFSPVDPESGRAAIARWRGRPG